MSAEGARLRSILEKVKAWDEKVIEEHQVVGMRRCEVIEDEMDTLRSMGGYNVRIQQAANLESLVRHKEEGREEFPDIRDFLRVQYEALLYLDEMIAIVKLNVMKFQNEQKVALAKGLEVYPEGLIRNNVDVCCGPASDAIGNNPLEGECVEKVAHSSELFHEELR